jgi:hypothetical protein
MQTPTKVLIGGIAIAAAIAAVGFTRLSASQSQPYEVHIAVTMTQCTAR